MDTDAGTWAIWALVAIALLHAVCGFLQAWWEFKDWRRDRRRARG